MTLQKKQSIFALNMSHLIQYIFSLGYSCSIGEVYRTPEQAKIYAEQGKGIINSLHCKKLAVDIQLFDANGKYLANAKDYQQLATYWESLNPLNRSGIKFPKVDANHFEMQDL